MKIKLFFSIIILTSVLNAQQMFFELGDLKLKSGTTLTDTKIGYRTFGKMNDDKSNVVAFLSWYAGSSEDMIWSLGRGKLIDTTIYFAILVDALGNGISTSPTNYTGKLPFPEITISDMVNSQYLLFTKHLGLNSIHAIIGGSMGGMQVYQWMVSYPEFARKFIPYVGTPIQSSVNQLNFEVSLQILQTIEKYGVPDSIANRIFDLNFYLLARTSLQVDTLYEPGEYKQLLDKFKGVAAERFPASNRIAQMKAMIDHDITKDFGGTLEETAKRVKGEVFIIVSASDQLILPYQSIKFARLLKTDLMVIQNDCGHLGPGCDLKLVSNAIAGFLAR
jgi:homoserine O-acetyltransferase